MLLGKEAVLLQVPTGLWNLAGVMGAYFCPTICRFCAIKIDDFADRAESLFKWE